MIPFDAPSFFTGALLLALGGVGSFLWNAYREDKKLLKKLEKDVSSAFDKIRQLERDKWDKLKGL